MLYQAVLQNGTRNYTEYAAIVGALVPSKGWFGMEQYEQSERNVKSCGMMGILGA